MTGLEAEAAGRRIAIHLRKNQFGACHHIITGLKRAQAERRGDYPTAIAELPIDLRYVNMLEEAGYILISDLNRVDLNQLKIKHLGERGIAQIQEALRVERKERERRESQTERSV